MSAAESVLVFCDPKTIHYDSLSHKASILRVVELGNSW